MASAAIKGDARFEFTGVTGLTSPFLLAVPLSPLPEPTTARVRSRWAWRSMDDTTRFVVTVDGETARLFATIRFDDQPTRLRRLLQASLDGEITDLVYRTTAAGTQYSVEVESVGGSDQVEVRPDRQRGGFDEWEAGPVEFVLSASDLAAWHAE